MSRGARLLAACVAALTLAPSALAEPGSWEGGGPPAPIVGVLEIDPVEPSTVYGGGLSAAYATDDAAGTWRRLGPFGEVVFSVNAIEVNPAAHREVYVQAGTDIFRSRDAGATWTRVGPGNVGAFALLPGTPATLLAGTYENGLQRSTDGGDTWSSSSEGIREPNLVAWLAAAPSDPDVVYVFSGALYRSADGGRHWTEVTLPVPDSFPFARAVDPFDADTLYVGDGPIVWRTTDGGETWESRSEGLPDVEFGFIPVLAAAASRPGTLYALTDAALYRTANGGGHWQLVNDDTYGLTSPWAIAVDPEDPLRIYRASGQGLLLSTDGGVTFDPAGRGLPGLAMHAIAAGAGGTVVASPLYGGVYASADGGRTWSQGSGADIDFEALEALAVDAAGRVYAGTYRGWLFRSANGGLTWLRVARRFPAAPIWHLEPDPGRDGRVLAATELGVYRTGNIGDSWRRSSTGLPNTGVRSLAFAPSDPSVVYAGLDRGGVYRSANGGRSWQRAALGRLTVLSLAVDPGNPDVVYAATRNAGLWRSINRGHVWARIAGSGLTASVTIDPATRSLLYASGSDVLMAGDGQALAPYDEGLPAVGGSPTSPEDQVPRTVVALAAVPGGAVAATWGGVYRVELG